MTIENDSIKTNQVTKEPTAPTTLNVTEAYDDKENQKKRGIKKILKGFIKSAKTNKATKEPMVPTTLNVTEAHDDKDNHETAQIEMVEDNHETAAQKLGTITKFKVLISDKKYISKLTKKLKEVNGKLLKDTNGEINQEIKRELRVNYNVELQNNTLLRVVHEQYYITPLLLAVKENLTELAKAILSMTDENLDIQDNEGMNVLHCAAKNNYKLTVEILLQKKLQIDVPDKNGKTALHHAAENNCGSIVKTLLQHRANINALDKHRNTPLFYATIKNHSTLADFMMTKGALVDIKDKNEETITGEEENAEITQDYDGQDYNGEYELLADTLLENKNTRNATKDTYGKQLITELLVEIPPANENNESPSEENLLSEQPTTTKIPPANENNESPSEENLPSKQPWLHLRQMPEINLPSKLNKANENKGAYKTALFVASTSVVITVSMLTYYTELSALAIIGITFASALIFGSFAAIKPMSKLYNTDCSQACNVKNHLFR